MNISRKIFIFTTFASVLSISSTQAAYYYEGDIVRGGEREEEHRRPNEPHHNYPNYHPNEEHHNYPNYHPNESYHNYHPSSTTNYNRYGGAGAYRPPGGAYRGNNPEIQVNPGGGNQAQPYYPTETDDSMQQPSNWNPPPQSGPTYNYYGSQSTQQSGGQGQPQGGQGAPQQQ